MLLKLLCDVIVGEIILAGDDDAGGIHIDAVDDARAENTVDAGELVPAVVHQPIYQRAAVMPCGRVHHHPFGFVNENDVPVFVYDIQIHGLGQYLRLHGIGDAQRDFLAAA